MISNTTQPSEAYVWIWLPGETKPVVAGRIYEEDGSTNFIYGQSYLARPNAIAISEMELPLRPGPQTPAMGLKIAGAIRDSAPDAWGRRVILNRKFGKAGLTELTFDPLNEIAYLLESGSDRVGALDFQFSATEYLPRLHDNPKLDELLTSAERVDQGLSLTPELASALQHGTSIGGARPKALIESKKHKYIAKFSSSSDTYNVVKAEFVAMRLAKLAGLDAATVEMHEVLGKDVLLVERFDRIRTADDSYVRESLISTLSLLGIDEMFAHYASYADLADIIRQRFEDSDRTLRELFGRLVLNVAVGNTDDHARNHAALWNGKSLRLSPAYDICPQRRLGREANQALSIFDGDRTSRLVNCLNAAKHFRLNRDSALQIVIHILSTVAREFDDVCNVGNVAEVDRNIMRATQMLNDYAFDGLPSSELEVLSAIRVQFRSGL